MLQSPGKPRMKKNPIPVVAAVVLCLSAARSPAQDKPAVTQAEALKFNEAIVQANKKLLDAGFALGRSMRPILQDEKDVDLPEVKKQYESATKALASVVKEMKELKVPASRSAAALYEAHQKF